MSKEKLKRLTTKIQTPKSNHAITLIALIITIVVMLILVAVTLSIALGENGVINSAKEAKEKTNIEIEKEKLLDAVFATVGSNGKVNLEDIVLPEGFTEVSREGNIITYQGPSGKQYEVENITGKITEVVEKELIVYDSDGWKYAWTSDGTTWSDMIEKSKIEEGTKVDGKIIAKIYETEEAVSVDGLNIPEGKGYHLKIEGKGKIPEVMLIENETTKTSAWIKEFYNFATGVSTSDPVLPYITKVIIEDGVTNISDYAFINAVKLENIIIPNSVTTIGINAFEGCVSLYRIVIPGSISIITDNAFYGGCFSEVVIEYGVTEIDDYAFGKCKNLSKLVIPDSVTRIEDNAFEGCQNLSTIIIPKSVEYIGSRAFYNCKNLKNVYIESTSSDFEAGDRSFWLIAENSTIFVRNYTIATQLNAAGAFKDSTTVSTDYTWTAPVN